MDSPKIPSAAGVSPPRCFSDPPSTPAGGSTRGNDGSLPHTSGSAPAREPSPHTRRTAGVLARPAFGADRLGRTTCHAFQDRNVTVPSRRRVRGGLRASAQANVRSAAAAFGICCHLRRCLDGLDLGFDAHGGSAWDRKGKCAGCSRPTRSRFCFQTVLTCGGRSLRLCLNTPYA